LIERPSADSKRQQKQLTLSHPNLLYGKTIEREIEDPKERAKT
jgi:hypothetical protein